MGLESWFEEKLKEKGGRDSIPGPNKMGFWWEKKILSGDHLVSIWGGRRNHQKSRRNQNIAYEHNANWSTTREKRPWSNMYLENTNSGVVRTGTVRISGDLASFLVGGGKPLRKKNAAGLLPASSSGGK